MMPHNGKLTEDEAVQLEVSVMLAQAAAVGGSPDVAEFRSLLSQRIGRDVSHAELRKRIVEVNLHRSSGAWEFTGTEASGERLVLRADPVVRGKLERLKPLPDRDVDTGASLRPLRGPGR